MFLYLLLSLTFLPSLSLTQTKDPPFIMTASGGLFFPARTEFTEVYKVNSDLMWSYGIGLPVTSGLFITGEIGKFTSNGFFDSAIDSAAHYEEKMIHIGVLNKRPLSESLVFRVSAGINHVNVIETTSSPRVPDKSVETGTMYGFYGGVGVEETFGEPHISLFVDVAYDYARNHDKTFSGDFGGIRTVLGLNIIMFD